MIFLPDETGGVQTFVDNYVEALVGFRIKVIRYKVIASLFNQIEKRSKGNVQEFRIGFSKYATERSKYRIFKRLISRDDILICNDSLEVEFINAFQLKSKLIYILHGDLTHYGNILGAYKSSIDLVLCVSKGLKEKYQSIFPDLKFGISHPFLIGVPEFKLEVREKLSCIFVGKFEYQKGADLFLDLVRSFKGNVNWSVAIISKGSQSDLLKQIPIGVVQHVDLSNKEVLEILVKSDVLIFPSRTEGFGIAILEAMSRGVIPIVLDIPIGIPDQVIHDYNGFIINIEKWKEAGCYIGKLESDNSFLNKTKLNAVKFVEDHFNSAKISSEFIRQIYDSSVKTEKKFRKRSARYVENLPELLVRPLKYLKSKVKNG